MDITTKDDVVKALLKLHDDTLSLIEYSTKWQNNANDWRSDEHLGPMWEQLDALRTQLELEYERLCW